MVYSPGYEDQQARFTEEEAFGWIPFAEPILCAIASLPGIAMRSGTFMTRES